MWSLALLGIIVFGVGAVVGFETELKTVKSGNLYPGVETVRGAFNLARDALKNDGDWNDCSGADQNCSEADSQGFFPIYSSSLGETLEKVSTPQGFKYTVKMKPVSSDEAYVIVHVEGKGINLYQGAKFVRGGGRGKIPLVYSPSSTVDGGTACSWYWDGNKLRGETNPDFTVYLDSNFYWSPEIDVPSNPAGPNPKDVEFVTNFDTSVSGYKEIDKVYTTGDLYLENGAHLGLAYANGKVYVDDDSSADKIVENGNLKYPDFADDLDDLSISPSSLYGARTFYCYGGSVKITGVHYYENFYAIECNVTLENATVYVKNYYDYKSTLTLNDSTLNVSGNAYQINSIWNFSDSSFVSNYLYTYNSEMHWTGEGKFKSRSADIVKYTVYPDSLFHFEAESVNFSQVNDCTNPEYCLWDFNDGKLYGNSMLIGTVLSRNSFTTDSGSTVIGNVFAEELSAQDTTFCNIVDSNGNQVVADKEGFYSLIAPDGIVMPGTAVTEVAKVVCSDESDCLEKLSQ